MMLWQRNFLASMGIFAVQPSFFGSVNHIALSQGPAPYTAMWHGSWIRSKAVTLGITGPTMDLQLLRTIGATRHHRGTSNRLANDDISICYRNKYHNFGVFLQSNPRHIYIYVYINIYYRYDIYIYIFPILLIIRGEEGSKCRVISFIFHSASTIH